jgi:hypothetical protein
LNCRRDSRSGSSRLGVRFEAVKVELGSMRVGGTRLCTGSSGRSRSRHDPIKRKTRVGAGVEKGINGLEDGFGAA